ncbi:asparagine synthase-related protein [Actinoplanes sp. NPDC051513]|uniref:asparagine synthase-related protein n=1 Tax=Actinoplanes sp. NPDC051513 TaxID=3363908 RepID=UPI00379D13B9
MRAFLAVSVAPGAVAPAPARRLLATAQLGPAGKLVTLETDHDWVVLAGAERAEADGAFTVRLTNSVRSRTGDLGAAALARLVTPRPDGPALAGILPPFAVAHREGPRAPIVAVTDWLGLRQLFWWQGDGVAAVSTSALALAALSGAGIDAAAARVQSLVGWQLGLDTLFAGVTKLGPAGVATLASGRVTLDTYAEPLGTFDDQSPDPAAVVDEMAGVLREIHAAYLTDHPGTMIQLTGGQDSRILLCSTPAELRPRLRAMTLGTADSPDVRVAAKLAASCGIPHEVLRLDRQDPIDPATAHALALEAARLLDGMASPLALAPLLLAESRLEQGHRLSGIGGETARGFFYPGQPGDAQTSARLVQRLAQWRLFANEAVATEALGGELADESREGVHARLEKVFGDLSRDWLRATDEFYLFQRTQRWAGAHGTPASVSRHFVNPLLDRRVMELALAARPADKRDSRLSGRLMQRLDPGLAAMPLDSGLVPARLANPGAGAALSLATVKARKVTAKVRQRLRGAGRAQLGAAEMAGLVVAHWRAEPGCAPVNALRTGNVVDDNWLGELLDGRREADTATVAFLINLAVAGEVTGVKGS